MSRNSISKKSGGRRLLPLAVLAALAVVAVVYGIFAPQGNKKPAEGGGASVFEGMARGAMKRLTPRKTRKDMGELTFVDEKGRLRKLSEWKGKVVLVNFWATWCFPCRREMPEIGRLQKAFDRKDFEVIAVSEDKKGYQWAKQGLYALDGDNLTLMMDPGSRALRAIGERGLPTTLLIDRRGREFARLIGPAAWASEEAKAVIRAAIAEK